MPTYEYVCRAGHEFEHFQSMSSRPLRKCLQCGKPAKRKISAGGGLLFKGSGFYITDYRSSDYQSRAKSDAAPAAETKAKSDTAPAAAADGKTAPSSGKEGAGATPAKPAAEPANPAAAPTPAKPAPPPSGGKSSGRRRR